MPKRNQLGDLYEKLPLFERADDQRTLDRLHDELDRIDALLMETSYLLNALQPFYEGRISLRHRSSKTKCSASWFFYEWMRNSFNGDWYPKHVSNELVMRKLHSSGAFYFTHKRCRRLAEQALQMVDTRKRISTVLLRLRQANMIIDNSPYSTRQWAQVISEVALETNSNPGNGFDISEDDHVQDLLLRL
ncbi:hypothetical protein [Crenobacter intestini]|uniref:Uncharacterized protein n=1 Tax=Crenobacter intestini TaxID=2563443 RepID=A0A4T0UK87_9NEIS|nr:hypothetical protein [Crenobacter intestini]TIC78565.1 hypothetical protein E5K04_15745 [Crenobacter intestini]